MPTSQFCSQCHDKPPLIVEIEKEIQKLRYLMQDVQERLIVLETAIEVMKTHE